MFLQIPKETDFEDEERIMEVSFSRLKYDGKGEKAKKSYLVIQRAIPRLLRFKKSDTMVDIKMKLYDYMKEAWKFDDDDEIKKNKDKYLHDYEMMVCKI